MKRFRLMRHEKRDFELNWIEVFPRNHISIANEMEEFPWNQNKRKSIKISIYYYIFVSSNSSDISHAVMQYA